MTNFHVGYKSHSYFEGWYLKHQIGERVVAVIPAFHIDDKGHPSASIQVITQDSSHWINYPVSEFKVHPKRFCVKVGNSSFSELGVKLDVVGEGITVKGHLHYGPFTPPIYDIMGPFRFIPGMQCNHGVVSLAHRLSGTLKINEEVVDFGGGVGYIEKDWGSSFPSSYLWTQSSWYDRGDCSVMASIAEIQFAGAKFTGCISSIYYNGVEYRLATYHGVKICQISQSEVVLMQGQFQLHIKLLENSPHKLKAPSYGGMTRTIHESARCKVKYRFTVGGKVIFDCVGENASWEQDSCER